MKLIYLHGWASSGASGTVELLRKMLPSADVLAPDIPLHPEEALPMLRALVETEQPDVIVGISMGGMYAQQMFRHLRICVNPAFQMSSMSRTFRSGKHLWLHGRKNHEKEFFLTKEIMQAYNKMERAQWDGITPADDELCYGLFGIHDDTVNPINAYNTFRKHYTHGERFEGGHHLNDDVLHKTLLPLIKRLLPEQYEEARKEPLPDWMKYAGN